MAEAGLLTRYVAEAKVVHHVGASTSKFADFAGEYHRNRLAYYRKHFGRWVGPWVKLCVTTAFLDYCVQQWVSRLRRRSAQPIGPIARSYFALLRT
jgi:GT2 family glycosyltransferase